MSHAPRKRFGQNFLRDERIIHAMVSAISPSSDEHLVEIGPGRGALTRRLLPQCRQLDVIELDRDLVDYLRHHLAGETKLCIHAGDALKFHLCSLSRGEQLRVIGNLPYNISTPLLFQLFAQSVCIRDMHFMLQKEVVERLCAEPGHKEYGRLGIMASYFCSVEPLMDVPPESFYPAPTVMSSVVRMVPHERPPVEIAAEALNRVVTAAFSRRRKTLRNALGDLLAARELEDAGIDPGARAENLTLADFARLGQTLQKKVGLAQPKN